MNRKPYVSLDLANRVSRRIDTAMDRNERNRRIALDRRRKSETRQHYRQKRRGFYDAIRVLLQERDAQQRDFTRYHGI